MKRILTLLILLIPFLSGRSQESFIPEANWIMAQSYLHQQKEFSGIMMLGEGGEIKLNYGSGYTDRNLAVPFSDKSLFTIGSITKPFTATAILLLMDQGKLSVNDTISKYFKNVPDDKKNISIHHLLTHTSGLPGAIGDDYETISSETFQERAWQEPLLFQPGSAYEYSNVGYSLLGMIIEQVTQQSYSTFLNQNIFIPASMSTAGYTNVNADYSLLAHGYLGDGADSGTSRDKNWNGSEPYWHLKANGGLLMSAMDMYQWYLALKGNKVLSPELLTLQTTPYIDEGGGSYYSYGYAVDQEGDCVQHNGGNRIFKADFRWFPKGDYFLFAATNDANVRLFRLTDEIIQILKTGKLPELESWQEIQADVFPADENQRTAKAFAELIQGYTPEKGKVFVPSYCSDAMINRNGNEKLQDLFQMLHTDSIGASEKTFYQSGQKIQIVMPIKDTKERLKITLTLDHHKIDRLGAEIEGM